jgi:hypothetical protein
MRPRGWPGRECAPMPLTRSGARRPSRSRRQRCPLMIFVRSSMDGVFTHQNATGATRADLGLSRARSVGAPLFVPRRHVDSAPFLNRVSQVRILPAGATNLQVKDAARTWARN